MNLKLAAYPVLALCLAGAVGLGIETNPISANSSTASEQRSSGQPTGTATPVADIRLAFAKNGKDSVADSLLEQSYRIGEERRVLEVESGDTLMGMLTRANVAGIDATQAIEALRTIFDPRRLQVGQEVTMVFEHQGATAQFAALELMPDVESRVVVARTDDGAFNATEVANELETQLVAAAGTIDSSLYAATNAAGIPDPVLIDLIRILSYKIDFQRDLQPGDAFEILFEQDFTADGEFARNGDVLYATLLLSGRAVPVYRFESEDGVVDYYSREGESVRRLLMRTPIDGARMSSGFGMRHHPVLGYSRMHRGTDFAAPTGTPIYAAGDGVVDFIGKNKGYGNYIRLRHTGSISTAYAHMSKFAKGLNDGDRVAQGEIIGYVGTTGLSTGPHLHYEVLKSGTQINPMDLDLPTGRTLEGKDLAAFEAMVERIDRQFAELMSEPQVAARPEE